MWPTSTDSAGESYGDGGTVRKTILTALILATVLMVAAAPAVGQVDAELTFSGDAPAPNPYIKDDLTVTTHDGEWGYTHADMRFYLDNQGDKTLGKFVVNTTWDESDGSGNPNPYSFTVTDVEDDAFGAFPRKGADEDDPSTDASGSEDNTASALDASEWSKSGANSSELSISDTTTGPNVDAVRFDTGTSFTSGDIATATYGNWSAELDSDESKRVLMLGADVDTLDSGAEVKINVTDESGDYKTVQINSSKNYGDSDVLANATGDGYVLQVKLSTLTTNGGGSWDNIENVSVTVRDADADVSIAWFDLEKKGVVELGEKRHDSADSDSDWDDLKLINSSFKGDMSVHSMTTLPSMWDDAKIHDVTYPVEWRASLLTESGLDAEYHIVEDDAGSFVGYDVVANVSYRLAVPDAIELSHANLEVFLPQEWASERFVEFGINEGAGSTEFGQISYSDQTGSLVSAPDDDTRIVLDDTVSAGTEYALQIRIKLTSSEWSAMQSSGASTPQAGGGGGAVIQMGGLVDWIIGIPGAVIMLLSAGLARLRGWI